MKMQWTLSQSLFIILILDRLCRKKSWNSFFLETELMGLKIDVNAIILWSSESEEGSAFNEHCFISIKSL